MSTDNGDGPSIEWGEISFRGYLDVLRAIELDGPLEAGEIFDLAPPQVQEAVLEVLRAIGRRRRPPKPETNGTTPGGDEPGPDHDGDEQPT